jgi:hypothetical protein
MSPDPKSLKQNRPDIFAKYRWFAVKLNDYIQHLEPHWGGNHVALIQLQDDRGIDIPSRNE